MRRYITLVLVIVSAAVLVAVDLTSANGLVLPALSSTLVRVGQTKQEVVASPPSTETIFPTPSSSTANTSCILRSGVQFCIKGVSTDDKGSSILLESQVLEQGVRLLSRPYLPSEVKEKRFFLVDDQGRTYWMQEEAAGSLPFDVLGEGETGRSVQYLHFDSLPTDVKSLTLHIPAIAVQVPLRETVRVDIGSRPQAGDAFQVDDPIEIGEQVVHFVRAEIAAPPGLSEGKVEVRGDVTGGSIQADASQFGKYEAPSLRLKIFSASVSDPDEPQIMTILMGGLEEFPVRGSGFDPQTQQYELDLELLNSKAELVKTGMIAVPIIGAHLLWQDIQLSWDMPSSR